MLIIWENVIFKKNFGIKKWADWLQCDHVLLRNLNICRLASLSGGSLKKWEVRELWSPGNDRGKESERESRGWAGGWGRAGRLMPGSKPQNWDVILLRVCDWRAGGAREEKAGCEGQPGWNPGIFPPPPPPPPPVGEVLVSGSSSEPDSSLLRSLSPLVFISSSRRSGLDGPSISSSESESESCGSEDLLSPPRPDLSSPNP